MEVTRAYVGSIQNSRQACGGLDEYVLYPGNTLKQDAYYFTRVEYDSEGENRLSERSMLASRKRPGREPLFYHALTDAIITKCIKRNVGTLAVSWPEGMRESD